MQLVVDTNVLISALIAKSRTYEAIVFGELELFAPEHALDEVEKHKEELMDRMDVEEEEFDAALHILLSHVNVIPREEYEKSEAEAKRLSPDYEDFPFFALALAMKIPFWTNETRLKKQDRVQVYNTKEILAIIWR